MNTYRLYDHSESYHIINNILFNPGYHLNNKIRKLTFENMLKTYIPHAYLAKAISEVSTKAVLDENDNIVRVIKGTKAQPKVKVVHQIFNIVPDHNHLYYEVYFGYNLKYHNTYMDVHRTLKLILMLNTVGLKLYKIDMMPNDQLIEEALKNKSIYTDPLINDICDGHLNTLSLHNDIDKKIDIPGITCIMGFYRFSQPQR